MGGQRISIPLPSETQWKVFNPQSCSVFQVQTAEGLSDSAKLKTGTLRLRLGFLDVLREVKVLAIRMHFEKMCFFVFSFLDVVVLNHWHPWHLILCCQFSCCLFHLWQCPTCIPCQEHNINITRAWLRKFLLPKRSD